MLQTDDDDGEGVCILDTKSSDWPSTSFSLWFIILGCISETEQKKSNNIKNNRCS